MGLGLLDPGADQDVHQGVAAPHLDLLGRPRPIEQRGLGEPGLVSALGLAGEPVDQPAGQRQRGDLPGPGGRLEGLGGGALRGDRLRLVGQRLVPDQGGGAAEPGARHERRPPPGSAGRSAGLGAAAGSGASGRRAADPASATTAGSGSLSCVVSTPAAKPTPNVPMIIDSRARSRAPFHLVPCTRFTRLDVSVCDRFAPSIPTNPRRQCFII